MKYTLYGDYGIMPSQEQNIKRRLKDIIGSTPPNTTTLNKKAAINAPRYFTDGQDKQHYMLISTGLEVKNRKIEGKAGKLYLLFSKNNQGNYEYEKYYVYLEWYDLYEKLEKEFGLSLQYFINNVDANARALEIKSEETPKNVEVSNLETSTLGEADKIEKTDLGAIEETACSKESIDADKTEQEVTGGLRQLYKEQQELIDETTLELEDIMSGAEEDYSDDDSIADDNTVLDSDLLADTIESLPQGTDISTYISNIMTSFNTDDIMPSISVFYACIKQNGIRIDANLMVKLISRLVFIEWTDWLYTKIITTNELTHTGNFLIDTGFIKADGQPMYSIVYVDKNYPRHFNLDCSLTDMKIAGLDKSAARNQLTFAKKRLQDNPLTLDNIDFNNHIWKLHILDARRNRFGMYKEFDRETRLDMVIKSIEHACALEVHGTEVKRLVRASASNISVAIPLRYRNTNQTSTAIILTLNKFNIWEIATIETGRYLTSNIKAYNFYNMPTWLREVD